MPTYDVHTHVGADIGFMLRNWWPYAATAQDLLQHMDANGIDRAVVFPFCLASAFDALAFADRGEVNLLPGRVPFDRENQTLRCELDRLDPDHRLHMLAMFDPSREPEAQVKLLEPMLGQITGLKVQATILQSFIPDLLGTGRCLMEFADANQLPVLFHTTIHPGDPWSRVADCIAVAEAFPRVRFNLAHSLRFHRDSLKRAADIGNIWIDCSAHLAHCGGAVNNQAYVAAPDERVEADYTKPDEVLAVIDAMLGGRYMWGSDSPFMSWCDSSVKEIHTYGQEMAIVNALPTPTRHRMLTTAPEAWLLGTDA